MQKSFCYHPSNIFSPKIPYLIYYPDDFNPSEEMLPLIVFLHGGGERGNNPYLITCHSLPMLCQKALPERCIVLSPQCASEKDWYYYMPFLMEFIDSMASNYGANKNRISLTGISMGAFGVWELASLYPDRFCSLVPICGGGMSWTAENLVHIPIWAFHGALDDVVPVEASINMIKAINQAGGHAKLTIYPETGHHAWVPAYSEPSLLNFMLQK